MQEADAKVQITREDSIFTREVIKAPPDYVSVYHETKLPFLGDIAGSGLKITKQKELKGKGIGRSSDAAMLNSLLDEHIPPELQAKNISRCGVIYAYPFLEYGHGFMGADERYKTRSKKMLESEYASMARYSPEFLAKLGVTSVEEYVRKLTDPKYLRKEYPGEVLELKVEPEKCFVADLYSFGFVNRRVNSMSTVEEKIEAAKDYWAGLISLKDFLRWYRKPEWAADGDSIKDADIYRDGEPYTTDGFVAIKGCPENLPSFIELPEVLIPMDVPEEHIRLLD